MKSSPKVYYRRWCLQPSKSRSLKQKCPIGSSDDEEGNVARRMLEHALMEPSHKTRTQWACAWGHSQPARSTSQVQVQRTRRCRSSLVRSRLFLWLEQSLVIVHTSVADSCCFQWPPDCGSSNSSMVWIPLQDPWRIATHRSSSTQDPGSHELDKSCSSRLLFPCHWPKSRRWPVCMISQGSNLICS